jgi:UDP-galactopyranose mutase
MKVVILGGGLAGCTVGYLLKKEGHEVTIIEKNEYIGGICQTHQFGGVNYEFGPHVLYAQRDTNSYRLFQELMPEVREQKYFPKLSINGEMDHLCSFPPTVENVLRLDQEDMETAIEELYRVNAEAPDLENLEKFIISRVGNTMYRYFFQNYNKKHWGLDPKDMDTEWARYRNFFLRPKSYGMFGNAWQGHPTSYQDFFKKLTADLNIVREKVKKVAYNDNKVKYVELENETITGDIYISTIPIDQLISNSNVLEYRGVTKMYFLLEGKSDLPTYLCTFPNNYSFTRLIDYNLQSGQQCENSVISFAFPHKALEKDLPLQAWKAEATQFIKEKMKKEILNSKIINHDFCYPVSSASMLEQFDSLLKQTSNIENLITFGRLGLYSYISMCTIVEQSYKVTEVIDSFKDFGEEQKYEFYKQLRRTLV